MKRKSSFVVGALTLAAGAPVLAQETVLFINDGGLSLRHSETAASTAGLSVTEVGSAIEFQNALRSGEYCLAIYDNPNFGADAGLSAAIDEFVDSGGVVHFSYWNLDADPALQASMGVASAIEFTIPREVHPNGHASWSGPFLAIAPVGDPWLDNGDELTPAAGAELAGTFDSTSGPGAIVVANDGNTIANGFEYDTKEASAVQSMMVEQFEYLLDGATCPSGPCYADCDENGELDFFDFLCFQNAFAAGCQ